MSCLRLLAVAHAPKKMPHERPAVSGHSGLAPDRVTQHLLGRLQRMVKPQSTEID
jgi:hypothetical protein